MEKRKIVLRYGDILVYLSAFALLLFLFLLQKCYFQAPDDNAFVTIQTGNTEQTYPLNVDQSIDVSNNGFSLTVVIENRSVHVVDADCPDKVCENTGTVTHSGSTIACLPADCVITIASSPKGGISDVIAG